LAFSTVAFAFTAAVAVFPFSIVADVAIAFTAAVPARAVGEGPVPQFVGAASTR
jgi:hypothetical protein